MDEVEIGAGSKRVCRTAARAVTGLGTQERVLVEVIIIMDSNKVSGKESHDEEVVVRGKHKMAEDEERKATAKIKRSEFYSHEDVDSDDLSSLGGGTYNTEELDKILVPILSINGENAWHRAVANLGHYINRDRMHDANLVEALIMALGSAEERCLTMQHANAHLVAEWHGRQLNKSKEQLTAADERSFDTEEAANSYVSRVEKS